MEFRLLSDYEDTIRPQISLGCDTILQGSAKSCQRIGTPDFHINGKNTTSHARGLKSGVNFSMHHLVLLMDTRPAQTTP